MKYQPAMLLCALLWIITSCGNHETDLHEDLSQAESSVMISESSSEERALFPNLRGVDFAGGPVDSTIFQAHTATVVVFWRSDCADCISSLAAMQEFQDELKAQGAEILGIHFGTGRDASASELVRNLLREHAITFQNMELQGGAEVQRLAQQMKTLPAALVVNAKSEIVSEPIPGSWENADVRNRISASLDQVMSEAQEKARTADAHGSGHEHAHEEAEESKAQALLDEMSRIFAKNPKIWDLILAEAAQTEVHDADAAPAYADRLVQALENIKDKLTEKEIQEARQAIERIREIDEKIRRAE